MERHSRRKAAAFACLIVPALLPRMSGAIELGGSLGVSSDQVFRGLSQSGGEWGVQADLHAAAAGWFGGVWASKSDGRASGYYANTEVDPYLGYYWLTRDPWSLRTTYVHYFYPESNQYLDYDYDELSASIAYADRLSFTFAWSPNATQYSMRGWAENRRQLAYELTGRQPLSRTLALTASAGFYDLTDLYDRRYWAWSSGLEWRFRGLEVALNWFFVDTTGRELFGARALHGRSVLSANWRF